MGWHWGILASSGGAAGAFDLLATTIATGSSGTIQFTSIPSGYKHLELHIVGRCTFGVNTTYVDVQFNSDTGSNYAYHELLGVGSSVVSFNATSQSSIRGPFVTGSSASANIAGAGVMQILDYSSTSKNKTTRTLTGVHATDTNVSLRSGLWMNTNAITSIEIKAVAASNFTSISRFSLYGIK